MKDFESFLTDNRVFSVGQIETIVEETADSREPIYYRLLRAYPLMEEPIWSALSVFLDVELVDPQSITIEGSLSRLIPVRLAHEHSIVPISLQGNQLEVAFADPRQFARCDEYTMMLGLSSEAGVSAEGPLEVVGCLARPSHVAEMIKSLYGIGADTVQDMLESQPGAALVTMLEPEVVDLTLKKGVGEEDAAIIRFVNELLLEAAKIGASDIHLEPYERELRVRFRVDGMLQEETVPEKIKDLEAAIISRLKIMARMNIAEKRLPQDGQIRLKVMGRPIDVRVSVLPTLFGQGLALRLLDRQLAFRRLDSLGMPGDYLRLYRKVLGLSHGVILVTGPTGSGKTTTLYASINEINRPDTKIITVEDPIEYQLEGILQIQVNPAIDLTFSNVLRNILRHDPNCIMVGEIRDRDTARLAISAAMTGHLVFSTLHTNDASSTPVRLLDMGVEPYLVSSSLEAVIAQRLVRLLCPHCRREADLRLIPEDQSRHLDGATVYESTGCSRCRNSGYKNRTAIFEMFTVSDRIRQMIIHHATAAEIRKENLLQGMRTLYQSGLAKVRQGQTSLAEIYRVARDDTVDMKEYLQSETANDER